MSMSLDNFVDYLERSQLVNAGEIKRLLGVFRRSNNSDASNLKEFCSILMEQGFLTPWQCGKLRERKYKGFFLGEYVILEELNRTTEMGRYRARKVGAREMVTLVVHFPVLHFEVLPPD